MLDRQNQGPQCTACGSPMKLMAIEPSDAGNDLRTFVCPACIKGSAAYPRKRSDGGRLEPHDVAGARHGSTVTYEIRDGRMIPKSAK